MNHRTLLLLLSLMTTSQIICNHDNNNSSTVTVSPHQSANNQNTINVKVETNMQTICKLGQKVWTHITTFTHQWWQPKQCKDLLAQLITRYKYKGAAVIAATGYLYLYYRLYAAGRYLKKNDLWSSWQEELTLKELQAIPEETCAQELLHTIQMNYAHPDDPTNFINPLMFFLQRTEQEQRMLHKINILYSLINCIYLYKLFPGIDSATQNVKNRLERLAYIKNIFLSWIAHYNITHNKKISIATP